MSLGWPSGKTLLLAFVAYALLERFLAGCKSARYGAYPTPSSPILPYGSDSIAQHRSECLAAEVRPARPPDSVRPRSPGSSPFRRLRSERHGGRLCAYLKPRTTGVTPDNRPGGRRLRGSRRRRSSLPSSVEPYQPTV